MLRVGPGAAVHGTGLRVTAVAMAVVRNKRARNVVFWAFVIALVVGDASGELPRPIRVLVALGNVLFALLLIVCVAWWFVDRYRARRLRRRGFEDTST